MKKNINKPELLIPAGDYKTLKYALAYGADAVYVGGKDFSLRANANNFSRRELELAVAYTHKLNKKIYVTVNAFLHNKDFSKIKEYIKFLDKIKVDAVIISDPGLVFFVRKNYPNLNIHLSTQANTTNYFSTKFWHNQGINRIVLARELSLKEINEIIKHNSKNIEFETFVHGAMCIAYSGRCFLSTYLTGRSANKGDCAQPCRWKYNFIEEDLRKGELMYYEEDKRGAYIFNTKDMCMISHLKKLIDAKINSFKIEGRMKTVYYIACITRAYRNVIDILCDKKDEKNLKVWEEEVNFLNNRGYTTGFYLGKPKKDDYKYNGSGKHAHYFCGEILKQSKDDKITVCIKNTIYKDDKIEIITPSKTKIFSKVTKIFLDNEEIIEAKNAMTVEIILDKQIKNINFGLVRK